MLPEARMGKVARAGPVFGMLASDYRVDAISGQPGQVESNAEVRIP